MKKNRFIRISKRVMVLLLCCSLVSGACFNKYKVTANAAAMTVTLGSYAAYEICLYIGGLILVSCGLGAAIDNRDKIAEVGKNFIDSMNLDELSGWLLTKVNTAGQSYVYGTEALKEVQKSDFSVIQGGGNKPENNNDNDDDGDVDADDRTKELQQMGIWATGYLVDIIETGIEAIREQFSKGEENCISKVLPVDELSFTDYQMNEAGQYVLEFNYRRVIQSDNVLYDVSGSINKNSPLLAYYATDNRIILAECVSDQLYSFGVYGTCDLYWADTLEFIRTNSNFYVNPIPADCMSCSMNVPLFSSYEAALAFCQNGDLSDCLNRPKVYQIADWLQETWASAIEQLNTGIRSLADNMLIVGEAANQALINQANGLGYIEDLAALIGAANPFPLPGVISDPIYVPGDSPVPKLEPGDFPWDGPIPVPDPDGPVDPPFPDPDDNIIIGDYVIDLRKLFPFCIPFDFVALLRVLNAEPEAPRFEIPFVVPSVGIDEIYIIDLSMFDDAMEIIRVFELVGFVIGLMFLTGKVIKW